MPLIMMVLTALLVAHSGLSGATEVEGEDGYAEFSEELAIRGVDINRATMEELAVLPGISTAIAARIVEKRKEVGGFTSPGDLVRMGLVSERLYLALRQYIVVGRPEDRSVDRVSFRARGSGNWPEGGEIMPALGIYQRIQWDHGDTWTLGAITERDPGEPRLADQWKISLACRREGLIRRVIAGNMRYELAGGLLFFTRSRISISSFEPGVIGRRGRGLGIDLSASEGYPLRGIGMEVEASPRLSVTVLGSSTPLDVDRDEVGRVTSIRSSGYHPSSSRADRGGVHLRTLAGHAAIRINGKNSVGLTMADLSYSEEIFPPLDEVNFYSFRGSRRDFAGIDWDFTPAKVGLFGEAAVEFDRGHGLVAGVEGGKGLIRWNFLVRDYSPDFSPPFGNPFQDGSGQPANERGIYTDVAWRWSPDLLVALYLDTCHRPWRREREPFPSSRSEVGVEAQWRMEERTRITVRYLESQGEAGEMGGIMEENRGQRKRKLRLQVDVDNSRIKLRGRYELVLYRPDLAPGAGGSLLYFDSRVRPRDFISIYLRVSFFGVESSRAMVYAYENDLPGVMHISSFSGEGMRWYVYGRYHLGEHLAFSAKYSEEARLLVEGSGPNSGDEVIERGFGMQIDVQY